MKDDDVLMSLPQAGKEVGLGRVQIWTLVSQGRLPAVRVGRQWCVKASDVANMPPRKRGRPVVHE